MAKLLKKMIAIQPDQYTFSERWIPYCEEKGIPFKIVDCYANNIIEQLEGCDALLWHHHRCNQRDIVFARELLFALEQSGMKVFPDFNTSWYFNDKLGQKYLFEKMGIEAAQAFVFYTKKEALAWIETASFPKVFKLRVGAGSSNVKLAKDKAMAVSLVNKAFGSGFSQYQAMDNLKERIRKYRKGKTSAKDVLKGIVRLVKEPAYAKIGGKEMGYIYFQEFIAGNDHDIRVVVVGDKACAIKRMVRANDFRASGGGHILYEKELFDDSLIKLSFDINDKIKSQCIALDFVFDNGKPLVVEISFGFAVVGYDPCPGYWTKDLQWHEGTFNPYGWMVDDILKSISK
jgi:glutathione synthase/RimK-type ligase-like ATP-grasp enzyme